MEKYSHKYEYCTAEHTSGLQESIDTEKPIEKITFEKLLKADIYEFYFYDERINADVYMLKSFMGNYGLPLLIRHYKGEKDESIH